ncbi:PepSY domain-containing protein [Methylosinus sp. LW3]|jgi:uncharacterized membrane protein YkoI|uniref:PepSY domain-containing protein n=1 Tax=Methylosinus sp. LW3 TaxID=107635 RepID=UPI000686F4F5|nr:PepSY domain-containing protein [Methylosinus sp. LW3]
MPRDLRKTRSWFTPLIALVLASAPGLSQAREAGAGRGQVDHDGALQAFEQGKVLRLETVLSEIRKSVRGEVVGIALTNGGESGEWVYEFKILAPGNLMVEVYADARTAAILSPQGRR